jgi:NADH-quinone oxidoreductase subunit K
MCIEMMLNSINLLFVAFSVYHNDPAGHIFVFFVMVVSAAEIAVGLALVVMVYRHTHSIDIDFLNKLKW